VVETLKGLLLIPASGDDVGDGGLLGCCDDDKGVEDEEVDPSGCGGDVLEGDCCRLVPPPLPGVPLPGFA
jgi:hypothetical protein